MREFGNNIQYPTIVCVACWWNFISIPTRVVYKLILGSPLLLIERWVCHNEICFKVFVLVVGKCIGCHLSKICRNTTDSQIHFCQFESGICVFLTVNRHFLFITAVCFYELDGLNKHTTRTATRVIKYSIVRLKHFGNQVYNTLWCVELSFTFSFCKSELTKEILIYTTYNVVLFIICIDTIDFIKQRS